MHGIGWTAWRTAALGLAAATLAASASPAAAAIACAGPVAATGTLGAVVVAPGTGRPVAAVVADTVTENRKGPAGAVLAGVLVPTSASPAARAAIAAAVAEIAPGPVSIHAERPRLDRRGRIAGAVETADGRYLQAELIARGLAVADGEDGPCAAERAAAERNARAARRGLWADGSLPRAAAKPVADLPDFLIVAGTVRSVGKSGRTTYLNFGHRYSDDLTVRLTSAVAEGLSARGLAPETLSGRRVILRGWAEPRDGVDIALASPAALELEDGSTAR